MKPLEKVIQYLADKNMGVCPELHELSAHDKDLATVYAIRGKDAGDMLECALMDDAQLEKIVNGVYSGDIKKEDVFDIIMGELYLIAEEKIEEAIEEYNA